MMLEEQFGELPLALFLHERKAKTAKKMADVITQK